MPMSMHWQNGFFAIDGKKFSMFICSLSVSSGWIKTGIGRPDARGPKDWDAFIYSEIPPSQLECRINEVYPLEIWGNDGSRYSGKALLTGVGRQDSKMELWYYIFDGNGELFYVWR